jgi:hypothetical protein
MGSREHNSQLEGIEYGTVEITLEIGERTFRHTSELYNSGPSGQRTGVHLECDGTVTADVDEIILRVESMKRQPIGDATNLESYSCANSIVGRLVDSGQTLELTQPRGGPVIQLRRP